MSRRRDTHHRKTPTELAPQPVPQAPDCETGTRSLEADSSRLAHRALGDDLESSPSLANLEQLEGSETREQHQNTRDQNAERD